MKYTVQHFYPELSLDPRKLNLLLPSKLHLKMLNLKTNTATANTTALLHDLNYGTQMQRKSHDNIGEKNG